MKKKHLDTLNSFLCSENDKALSDQQKALLLQLIEEKKANKAQRIAKKNARLKKAYQTKDV